MNNKRIDRSTLSMLRSICGGGGGNRTPVRKHFNRNFSGRRRSFAFPYPSAGRHARGFGSFMMRGTGKAYCTHVPHSSTPHPGPWDSRMERSPLKQREEQCCRCSLIYKGAHFKDGRRIRPLFLPPRPRRNQYTPISSKEARCARLRFDPLGFGSPLRSVSARILSF